MTNDDRAETGRVKKLLMISYYFPPVGGPQVIRTLKFAKYLRQYGVEPVIVTSSDYMTSTVDQSLLKAVPPNLKVYRAFSLNKFNVDRREGSSAAQATGNVRKTSLLRKVASPVITGVAHLVKTWLLIPDGAMLWAPFAVLSAVRVAHREKVDAVYTTGPPYTNHFIGYLVKKLTGKPLIVDYRDRWNDHPNMPAYPGLRKRIERRMEENILQGSARVICVTPPMVGLVSTSFPRVSREKFRVITNGYDPDDYSGITPEKSAKFTITYSGVFYIFYARSADSPNYFIEAVRQLVEEHPQLKEDLQVLFVGRFPEESKKHLEGLPMRAVGFVPHDRSIQYILGTDVALLFLFDSHDGKIALPTKFFEYLGARKPILAITSLDGIIADVIRGEGLGEVVRPDDVAGIKQAVYQMYLQYRQNKLPVANDAVFRKFDRRTLAGDLAALVTDVTDGK